jgi:hypothetical protein
MLRFWHTHVRVCSDFVSSSAEQADTANLAIHLYISLDIRCIGKSL